MILLTDEDDEPVGAQVNTVIGEALRQSVAEADVSPGFQARLDAALDAIESQRGGRPSSMRPAGEVEQAAGAAVRVDDGVRRARPDAAGQGSEAAEIAS